MISMFRNFVNPPSLDRDSLRTNGTNTIAGSDNNSSSDVSPGHSNSNLYDTVYPSRSDNGATIVQSNESLGVGKGGGYTTNIFVSAGKQPSTPPQPQQPHHNHRQIHHQQQASPKYPSTQIHVSSPKASSQYQNGCSSTTTQGSPPATLYNSCDRNIIPSISPSQSHQENRSLTSEQSTELCMSSVRISETDSDACLHHQLPTLHSNNFDRPLSRDNHIRNDYPALSTIDDEGEDVDLNLVGDISTHLPPNPPPQPSVPSAVFSQKTFHVVAKSEQDAAHGFVGRRDVRDPKSAFERQIVSSKGTVRGFKNRVKAGIATFWAHSEDAEVSLKISYIHGSV